MSTTAYCSFPDQVRFGFNVAQKTGVEAKADGARHVLVIADPGVVEAGLIEPIIATMTGGIAHNSQWLGTCHTEAHQLSGFATVLHDLASVGMLRQSPNSPIQWI